MQIDSHTPQAELERLFRGITRRELLQGTPLNIKMFLRYALLFVLFPGMLGGFWVGMGVTLVFCAVLVGLLMAGMQEQATLAVQVWLCLGLCVLVWVCLSTTRSALALYRMRNTPLSAGGTASAATPPAEQTLRWRKSDSGEAWEAELSVSAPEAGIYALLLRVQEMKRSRLLTLGRRGVCCVQSAVEGEALQVLLLYKLEAGEHCLRWALAPRRGAAPAASVIRLN